MKTYKKLLSLGLAGCMAASLSSCRDDMVDQNMDPSAVNKANPTQLFVNGCLRFDAHNYGVWFFNSPVYLYTAQMAAPSASMTEDLVKGGTSGHENTALKLIVVKRAMENEMSKLSPEEAAAYESTAAALDVLTIYLGINDTDDYGDIAYTEAGNAPYGGTLTPGFDTVESLYEMWLKQLDANINQFLNPSASQITVSGQDIVYGWDWTKWARLANSIKLKIAVRLMNHDMARAKQIVSEVLASPAGVISNASENFYFHKADQSLSSSGGLDAGDIAYNTTNTTIDHNGISATEPMVNFLVENGDPRVRFLYEKNSWNSKVVDYYLANGHKSQIPSVVMENVETEMTDGVERFKAWKGKGEPWVRYHGLPVQYNAANENDSYMKQFFHYSGTEKEGGNQITDADGNNYSFRPYSTFNEELVQGRIDFTVPVAPEDTPVYDRQDNPHYGMYLMASEVNFYLAEFATIGGVNGLSRSANDYFQAGVRASVEEWDKMCADNRIPYYGTTYDYDPFEATIDLKAGEIDALLSQPAYQLTGDKASDLEKIYLNELIHFSYQPKEVFVTARRSGVPSFGSDLFPRYDYSDHQLAADQYPRRVMLTAPTDTDLMHDILIEKDRRQGFSYGFSGGILNTQRIWNDQSAPQYGEGPQF